MKRVAFLGSLLLMACAGSKGGEPTTGSNDVIGGVDAKSASLNAIGALVYKDPATGQLQELCTGTLISKDAVLSAKHCAVQFTAAEAAPDSGPQQIVETRFIDQWEMFFAIGFDSAQARLVKLSKVDLCTDYDGGTAQLGCDVSVYRTAEPINDVTPLGVASAHPAADVVGQRFTAVGYGIQNETQTKLGTRKAGSLTVRATTGAYLPTLYPTLDAFGTALTKYEGAAFVSNNADAISQIYASTLKDGYEMFAGGGENDAQICFGDSGGPLVQKVDGKLVVVGVASTVGISGAKLPCNVGAVYATFGPVAQDLIKSNLSDPCEGVTEQGKCDGDVAVRCTSADEGPRRLVKNDCAALLGRCVMPAADADAGSDAGAPTVTCE